MKKVVLFLLINVCLPWTAYFSETASNRETVIDCKWRGETVIDYQALAGTSVENIYKELRFSEEATYEWLFSQLTFQKGSDCSVVTLNQDSFIYALPTLLVQMIGFGLSYRAIEKSIPSVDDFTSELFQNICKAALSALQTNQRQINYFGDVYGDCF